MRRAPLRRTLLAGTLVLGCGGGETNAAATTDSGAPPQAAISELGPAPSAGSRVVALTFDDVPRQPGAMTCADPPAVTAMNRRLVDTLVARGAPAVALATGFNGCPPDRVAHLSEVVRLWADAGMTVGNHTWSHPDINALPLDAFLADADSGAAVVRRALGPDARPILWFRHPFLHAGDTPAKKNGLERSIERRGWRVAPVTFDNSEWVYAAAYRRALGAGDSLMIRRLARDYVAHMDSTFAFFEAVTDSLFGRPIPQVLLLHASPLNADRVGAVMDALERRGYRFVTLEEAVTDSAYDSPDAYVGPAGLSWLLRWARTRGQDPGTEPEPPAWVMEYYRDG